MSEFEKGDRVIAIRETVMQLGEVIPIGTEVTVNTCPCVGESKVMNVSFHENHPFLEHGTSHRTVNICDFEFLTNSDDALDIRMLTAVYTRAVRDYEEAQEEAIKAEQYRREAQSHKDKIGHQLLTAIRESI